MLRMAPQDEVGGILTTPQDEDFPNQSFLNTIEAIQPVISAMQAVTSP
jgi:hypothetical protein